jgi:transcription initiation factor TFIIIB Brf1 subunit/transcription initiation factor TFIIB
MTNKPYSNLNCPECDNKGDFMRDDNEEVYCVHCGLVIESPYPYVAGIRFKTLSEILDDKRNERIEKKRWRRENARLKKLQKI